MAVEIDCERGNAAASQLHKAFSTTGVHGYTDMPEDVVPRGMTRGSLEHLLFITLTVSIDYQRDAPALWESSRRTFEGPDTRYLFDPRSLHETPFSKVIGDMQKYKLSKKPKKDARIWKTVGITFYKKWDGDPLNFLEACNWSAPLVLAKLKTDERVYDGRRIPDYPYLRGDKIGPLWLRMLRDNVGISSLLNLEKIPIPVDIHIARASLAVGIVRGQFQGSLDRLFEDIREAWFQSTKGLSVRERPMIALDVDEPLWHLSKYGCTYRDKITGGCPLFQRCEAKDFCVDGIIKIENGKVEMRT